MTIIENNKKVEERTVWVSSEYEEASEQVERLLDFVDWAKRRKECSPAESTNFMKTLKALSKKIDEIGLEEQ